jgi:hypothetical protein
MGIQNIYDVYDWVMRSWSKLEKNRVLADPSQKFLYFACEVRELRLFVELLIGPRGGLTERIILLDMSKTIAVDRILLNEFSKIPDLHIFETESFSQASMLIKKDRLAGLAACTKCIQRGLDWILDNPEHAETFLKGLIPNPCSIGSLSGGLPSLGKNY